MRNPALSFSNNAEFDALTSAVAGDGSVTLLCGAGVSVDARLPTWHQLLAELAAQRAREGDRIAALALKSTDEDLLRTAGLILRSDANHGQPRYAAVAGALYGQQQGQSASFLAQRIAHLAATIPDRLAIATTNFDDVIEAALLQVFPEVVTCSLTTTEAWWEGFRTPDAPVFHVLHLHGALVRGASTESVHGPIVLTEDEFHRYGESVQREVKRILDESDCVICIGLSVTDPNLVGPLSRRDRDNSHVFVVSTPSRIPAMSSEEAIDYVEAREQYLSEIFGVQVLQLSSYAQIQQLFVELELAASSPEQYRDPSGSSVRYGYRLHACLNRAYESLGYQPDGSFEIDTMQSASDRLHSLLDGLRSTLADLIHERRHPRSRALLRACGDVRRHIEQEGLGLFLWLPANFDPAEKRVHRNHELRLVGSSVYAHRDPWSFERTHEVSAYGEATVQRSAFTGQPIIEDSTPAYEPRLWRTNAATPLTMHDRRTDSVVTAGVVLLSSNKPLANPDQLADDDRILDWTTLSVLTIDQQVRFARALATAAADLLGVGIA